MEALAKLGKGKVKLLDSLRGVAGGIGESGRLMMDDRAMLTRSRSTLWLNKLFGEDDDLYSVFEGALLTEEFGRTDGKVLGEGKATDATDVGIGGEVKLRRLGTLARLLTGGTTIV